MQYSPKLKKAMEEINAILDKNDIAGIIILHTPGYAELNAKINPSYSCASFETVPGKGTGIRIKGKRERDFGGDKVKQHESLKNTSNMLYNLGTIGSQTIMGILEVSNHLDAKLGAEHTGGGFTSIQEQNS